MRIDFHIGARRDLVEGFRWYDKHSDRAAHRFYDQVSATLDKILSELTRYRPWKEGSDIRCIQVRGYPYLLYYTITGQRITILATAHEKRRQGYWLRRKI